MGCGWLRWLGWLAAALWVAAPARSITPRAAVTPHAASGVLRVANVPWPGHDKPQRLYVWRPAGGDSTQPVPVLYVMAGGELFDAHAAADGEEWGLDEFLAARAQGIPDLLVVAVEPGPDALRDLAPPGSRSDGRGEAYAQFVAGTVKPYVDAHWLTRRDAASNWIAGEDAGAAFAVYVTWAHSPTFGTGIGLALPAPERDTPAWSKQLPPAPAPRLWLERVTSARESPSTTALDAVLARGAQLQIRQAGPHAPRLVRLAAALRYAAQP